MKVNQIGFSTLTKVVTVIITIIKMTEKKTKIVKNIIDDENKRKIMAYFTLASKDS